MAIAITVKTFKYIELFAGIGGFRQALDQLGGECVFASEIDRFARQSYAALYGDKDGKCPELHGDITKIDADSVPDCDVLVGGFPCQAFSVAGQRKGFEDTRGTLFFEIARIASAKQPKLMLLENVKGLLSHDGGRTFETMCVVLNDIGYAIDFRVLNSKHFGVPQNRERIFIVASRDAEHDGWVLPKSSDVVTKAKRRAAELGVRTFNFNWPADGEVTSRLRDVLETDVDEKYYLSDEKTAKLVAQLSERDQVKGELPVPLNLVSRGAESRGDDVAYCLKGAEGGSSKQHLLEVDSPAEPQEISFEGEGVTYTLTRSSYHKTTLTEATLGQKRVTYVGEPQIDKVGHLPSDSGQTGAVYGTDGIAPTCLNQHGNAVTKVAVQMNRHAIVGETDVSHCLMARDYKGFGNQDMTGVIEEIRPALTPDREEKRQNGRRFKEDGGESFTLTAQDKRGVAIGTYLRYRIRKLTPLECWRLQGFSDAAHDIVKAAGISDSQRYKQAGNAVTVNVISAIGKRLITLLNVNTTKEAA